MRLDDWPLPYVRVKCAKCNREGRYATKRLIDRFGPDHQMYVVRERLTRDGCQREDKKQPCQSILPDGLLVQAIIEPDPLKVLNPSLLDEARKLREQLDLL